MNFSLSSGHTSNEENPPRKIIVDSNGERSVIHEEPITLQMLPDDAISNILSQLDDVKSLISFSLTNKVFQVINTSEAPYF